MLSRVGPVSSFVSVIALVACSGSTAGVDPQLTHDSPAGRPGVVTVCGSAVCLGSPNAGSPGPGSSGGHDAGSSGGGSSSGGSSSGGSSSGGSSSGGSSSGSSSSGGSGSGSGGSSGCSIAGVAYAAQDINPQNICQWCDPSLSATAWSSITDGAACGLSNEACFGGVCTSQFPNCTIGGKSYPPDAHSPTNPCAMCQPRQSETSWTNAADGTPCPGGSCFAGQCG